MRKAFILFLFIPLILFSQESPLKTGIEALKDGFYELAIKEFSSYLRKKDDDNVRFLLGVAYFKNGNVEKAYWIFEGLRKKGYKGEGFRDYYVSSKYNLALNKLSKGDEKGIRLLEELLRYGAGELDSRIRRILGIYYVRKGYYKKAINVLSVLKKKDLYVLFLLSEAFYRTGNKRKSMELLFSILKSIPLEKEKEMKVCELILKRGECPDIERLLEEKEYLLSQKPFFLKYLSCLMSDNKVGKIEDLGVKVYERGIFPCEYSSMVGYYFYSKGDIERAYNYLKNTRRCKGYEKEKLDALFLEGYIMFSRGDYKGAWNRLFPVYDVLENKKVAALILYLSGRNLGNATSLNFLVDVLKMTGNCTLFEDGISFCFENNWYDKVVSLYEGFPGCKLSERGRFMVGASYLRLGKKKGFSLLKDFSNSTLLDMAMLEKVIFVCKKGSVDKCRGFARSSLKRIRSEKIRKEVLKLLQSL